MNELIKEAVNPLRQHAIVRARDHATMLVERFRKELEAAGNDIDVVAPYPESNDPSYRRKKIRRLMFNKIVKYRNVPTDENDHVLADIDPILAKKFIEEAIENADVHYDDYISKMSERIDGEVVDADLTGNHVDSYSVLHVLKSDGSRENWRTRMVINTSKYGKLFNQFNARKVKSSSN